MVSGATVWHSLKRCQDTLSDYWKAFYIKRLFRIVPLFFFFSFTVFLFRGFKDAVYYFSPLAGLSPSSLNIVPGGWSIWNEIYFYLSMPIWIWIRRRGIFYIVSAGALVCCVSSSIGVYHGFLHKADLQQWSDFDYLNVFSQFVFFQAGIELAASKLKNALAYIFSSGALGLTLKLYLFPDYLFAPDFGSSFINALIALVLLCVFMGVKWVIENSQKLYLLKLWAIMANIGRYTYSMYVIHFAVLSALSEALAMSSQTIPSEAAIVIVLIITYIISKEISPITEKAWSGLGEKLIKSRLS